MITLSLYYYYTINDYYSFSFLYISLTCAWLRCGCLPRAAPRPPALPTPPAPPLLLSAPRPRFGCSLAGDAGAESARNGALGAAGASGPAGSPGAIGATGATGAAGAGGTSGAEGRASSPGYSLTPGKTSGLGAGVMGTGRSAFPLPLPLRVVGACKWRSERGQTRLEGERNSCRGKYSQKCSYTEKSSSRNRAWPRCGRRRELSRCRSHTYLSVPLQSTALSLASGTDLDLRGESGYEVAAVGEGSAAVLGEKLVFVYDVRALLGGSETS